MAITYTWSIDSLPNYPEKDGISELIFQVNWTLTGTDGIYTASEKGGLGLDFNPENTFTPYKELTQEQIIGWITSAMPEETLNLYKKWITEKLDQQKAETITPLPWVAA